MCRSFEAASSQLRNIANDTSSIENVKAVGQRYKKSPKNSPTNPPKKQTTARILCNYCGTEHPPIKEQCPTWGKPVAVAECETISEMYVAKLRKQNFMP